MKLHPFTKTFESRQVLDFPGMTLEKGKIYGIIGANGSGKSTFARVLCRCVPPDRPGAVGDFDKMGYMPQKNFAFRMKTVQNILLGGKDIRKAEYLMDRLGIRHLERKRADRLSGGETARMALARLMMGNYDLVLLDEPTAAMDMETTAVSEELIREYVAETGCALVLVTHSLQQARRLADEVWYFHKGQLLEHGPRDRMLEAPRTEELKAFLRFYAG